MSRAWGSAISGVALLLGGVGSGCYEQQFLLSVRNPETIEVVGLSEPVSRLTESAPSAAHPAGQRFADRGVRLHTGSELPYWRDGDWISSVGPIRIEQERSRVSIDYALHPGRRDLSLRLSLERDNVCELKTRERRDRALGLAGLTLGATTALFVPATAFSRDEGTREAAPYLGGVAAVSLIVGAVWLLWPAAVERVVVPPRCRAGDTPPRASTMAPPG